MADHPVPPILMLRSFLTIGSGYVLHIMFFFGIAIGLGYAFFPAFVDYLQSAPEIQQNMDVATAIPRPLFVALVILNSVACLGIGWYVFKTAPFAKFPHAIFMAVLVFLTYLQMAVGDEPEKKTMSIFYMLAFPIAILIGAKMTQNLTVFDNRDELSDVDQE